MIKAVEHKNKDRRVVRASIPSRGPAHVDGLMGGYSVVEGEPFVLFNDGTCSSLD